VNSPCVRHSYFLLPFFTRVRGMGILGSSNPSIVNSLQLCIPTSTHDRIALLVRILTSINGELSLISRSRQRRRSRRATPRLHRRRRLHRPSCRGPRYRRRGRGLRGRSVPPLRRRRPLEGRAYHVRQVPAPLRCAPPDSAVLLQIREEALQEWPRAARSSARPSSPRR
jgi:hypothetical protein